MSHVPERISGPLVTKAHVCRYYPCLHIHPVSSAGLVKYTLSFYQKTAGHNRVKIMPVRQRPGMTACHQLSYLHLLRRGITIHAMMYAIRPRPSRKTERTQRILMTVGSMPKYSPRPPHTPAIFLLVSERYTLLSISNTPFLPVSDFTVPIESYEGDLRMSDVIC